MTQLKLVNQLTQDDKEVQKQMEHILDSSDICGYVLVLRVKTEHEDREALHMFNVGNDLDELTDMLIAANQYLPSKEMEGK